MRVGAKIKLIDLDASTRYSPRLQFAGVKWSSAYLAPEMIHVGENELIYALLLLLLLLLPLMSLPILIVNQLTEWT